MRTGAGGGPGTHTGKYGSGGYVGDPRGCGGPVTGEGIRHHHGGTGPVGAAGEPVDRVGRSVSRGGRPAHGQGVVDRTGLAG